LKRYYRYEIRASKKTMLDKLKYVANDASDYSRDYLINGVPYLSVNSRGDRFWLFMHPMYAGDRLLSEIPKARIGFRGTIKEYEQYTIVEGQVGYVDKPKLVLVGWCVISIPLLFNTGEVHWFIYPMILVQFYVIPFIIVWLGIYLDGDIVDDVMEFIEAALSEIERERG